MTSRPNRTYFLRGIFCSLGLLAAIGAANECIDRRAAVVSPLNAAGEIARLTGNELGFSGCHVIGNTDTSKLRCCTLDIERDSWKFQHWCSDRTKEFRWSNPNFPQEGACKVGEHRLPGRRWYCAPKAPEPTPSITPTPRPPVTLPVHSNIDRDFPLVSGVYSRPSGGLYAGEALTTAREKFGRLSTFLWQKSLYAGTQNPDPSNGPGHDVESLFNDPDVMAGRTIPQISVDAVDPVNWRESRIRDLQDLKDKMCSPSSEEAQAMKRWARFFKSKGTPVQFRPFSEMNNPLDGHLNYHLLSQNAAQGRSRAEHLAGMWSCMRKIFRDEGANKVKFTINVTGTLCRNPGSVTDNQAGNQEWLRALRLIPPADVDAIGIHPYCRAPEPSRSTSAESMIAPWLREIDRTPHRGKPILIAEMGISGGYPDAERARWICEAYQYARKYKHRIRSMVYFDQRAQSKNWMVNPVENPKAYAALREALSLGLAGVAHPDDHCARTYR